MACFFASYAPGPGAKEASKLLLFPVPILFVRCQLLVAWRLLFLIFFGVIGSRTWYKGIIRFLIGT